MLAIERDNTTLKSVLPKDYAHPRLDKQRLGQLIDLVGNISLGDKANRSRNKRQRRQQVKYRAVKQWLLDEWG